jgi:acylpyruvate hydrolase
MNLVTFSLDGQMRLGALRADGSGNWVTDLNRLNPLLPPDMIAFLQAGAEAMALAQTAVSNATPDQWIDCAAVKLNAPVMRPGKIICIGQNYLEHAKESGASRPPFPIIFAKYANTVIGPGEPIVIPPAVEKPDYEGELAVVIGRQGRDIPESQALSYVAGYMPLNDVSARDWQNRTGQWVIGKTCDTFCPMGPALVTADEVPDPQNLHLRTVIGDEVLQVGYTGDMIFSVAFLIADMSRVMTLEPGDVIATGTPPGIGAARVPPRWLRPGDVVRVEIDGVGVLENPVGAQA